MEKRTEFEPEKQSAFNSYTNGIQTLQKRCTMRKKQKSNMDT